MAWGPEKDASNPIPSCSVDEPEPKIVVTYIFETYWIVVVGKNVVGETEVDIIGEIVGWNVGTWSLKKQFPLRLNC